MYLRILKKDLKRKKTMNIILLLFVILSAMFAASSVNNILSVVNGLDYFFEKANMPDMFYATRGEKKSQYIEEFLQESEYVTDYRREDVIYLISSNLQRNGKNLCDLDRVGMLNKIDTVGINVFDSNNEMLTEVEKGKIYIAGQEIKKTDLEIGDKITIDLDGVSKEFEFAGYIKDALYGSSMMSNPRYVINSEDYRAFAENEAINTGFAGNMYYFNISDEKAFTDASAKYAPYLQLNLDINLIRMTYLMDILVAAILMVLSIGLLIVSFVVLRFTIGFTISEEFREIGVMKAVGLNNSSIRGMYLVKYLGIAVLGASVGYILSVPFGAALLKSVSENMVLGSDNSVLIGIVCCLAVVAMIMLFCWRCTAKIKKLSPIDAVRNGQTGERFKKRSVMSLSKSRLGSTGFLSVNDILSAPRQYGLITFIFILFTLLIMVLTATANTIDSDSLLYLLSVKQSDVYLTDSERSMEIIGGIKTPDEASAEIEKILSDNDMPGKVWAEPWYQLNVEYAGKNTNLSFLQCSKTDTKDYEYTDGTAPMYTNEVAFAEAAAEKIGVKIGDTVKITIDGSTDEYLVSALFQSFDQMGMVGRLHQDIEIKETTPSSIFAFQIDFDDDPGKEVINERREKLKDIMNVSIVEDSREFTKSSMGVGDTMSAVRDLTLVLAVIIIVLISVLMERSFIAKERSEIALMKAIGFKERSVVAHHTLRFLFISIFAVLISASLCVPFTKLTMDPIFGMLGVMNSVEYKFDVLSMFVIYPAVMIAVTVVSVLLTSLYTGKVKASDTASIE
ncbi:ABC transporter permease [Ruminococcus albus]|uniref:Putative ABC transport system permease protein n=1 Tax=Ruminococcus albus TaxID=1264 RepID=A0A1I1PBC4_RUMAL|nr:ABC transporter permease [Ruminococcus albus]SFD07035.1 putative ABC transport system permease protein [Ruminococcus albus]